MYFEDSGSSIDGEIGFADSSLGATNTFESFTTTTDPSANQSPSKHHAHAAPRGYDESPQNPDNLYVRSDDTPRKNLSETFLSEDSLHQTAREVHATASYNSTQLNVSTASNVCGIFLPSCMKINSMLSERGLIPLELTGSDIDMDARSMSVFVLDGWAESIVSCLEEVFQRQDKQRSTVLETSFSSRAAETSREAMEKHMRDLQMKLDIAERKLSVTSRESENLEDSFEKNEKKLKSSEQDAKKKIKDFENLVKEGDRKLKVANLEIERMREKLRLFAAKDREARERYSDVLSGSSVASLVKGVSISPAKTKGDSRRMPKRAPPSPEDVVRALDADRIELEQYNAELREQVQNLSETIRDLQNGQRMGFNRRSVDNSGGSDHEDGDQDTSSEEGYRKRYTEQAEKPAQDYDSVPGSMKVLFGKIKDQQRRIEQLVHREGVLEAEKRRCDEALDVYRQRSSEMMEEIENLRIELDGRPSVRAYAQKQREASELESKLHDVIMMRKEAAEVASFKKYLSTGDRIKADKRNHELGLWIIESIPTAVVKEVLQSCCRELDISDISQLQPSIVKLKSVVRTVPRIEAFVTKLCGFVFDRQRPTYPEGDVKEDPVLEDVLPIIKKWWAQLNRGSELYKFQEAILKELDRRERILGTHAADNTRDDEFHTQGKDPVIPELFSAHDIDNMQDAYSWETRRRAMWMKRDPRVAVDIITDLVNFQLESFQDKVSYRAAADFIAQNPEKMVNRLISHLQYVFDVKDLQGLVPRMNQVYLSLEESRNLMNSLRECLEMKDAQNTVIISETLRRLSGKNQAEQLNSGVDAAQLPLRRQRT